MTKNPPPHFFSKVTHSRYFFSPHFAQIIPSYASRRKRSFSFARKRSSMIPLSLTNPTTARRAALILAKCTIWRWGPGVDIDMQYWSFENYAPMALSYSHRSLTFPSDAYSEISGVIRRAAQNLSTSFVATLPVHTSNVCNALLWSHHASS
jgi:hypothetical protein